MEEVTLGEKTGLGLRVPARVGSCLPLTCYGSPCSCNRKQAAVTTENGKELFRSSVK